MLLDQILPLGGKSTVAVERREEQRRRDVAPVLTK